jgi:MinD-like ATPase involved in chromosome partitioning or flagellar assembly
VQASPYGDYGSGAEEQGYEGQGYEGYGQPGGYGQGYGDYGQTPGYAYPQAGGYGQGYPAQAYPEGYGPAQPYDEQAYGGEAGYDQGQYGEAQPYGQAYGPGPGYGQPYGQGQAAYAPPGYGQPGYPQPGYGQPGYGPGQPYGQPPYGPGYGQDQGYSEPQSYGEPQGYQASSVPEAPPRAGTEDERAGEQRTGQEHGREDDQGAGRFEAESGEPGERDDRDGRDAAGDQASAQGGAPAPGGVSASGGVSAPGGAPGSGGARAQGGASAQGGAPAQAAAGTAVPPYAGQAAGPGPSPTRAAPYPPQDNYRWPSSTENPAAGTSSQQRPGPYGPRPYGQGRGDAGEAARPYGGEAGYPPRSPQGAGPPAGAQHAAVQAPGGESLTPLPTHGPEQPQAAETADDLTAEALLHGKGREPAGGWRRAVYRSSGGRIRPRESAEAGRRRDLINRVRTPVAGGHHRVAVMSLKGGVGKTTTTVGLGSMLASLRGDRIIALDANPDRGTLSDKVRLETAATVRDLLNERDQIHRYADVRAFTSQAPSRLEVLASDRDPAVSIAFSEEDYYDAARVLEHYYSISLTDCGTGLLHSAMAGVLRMADQIVLVSSPSVDGARSASATLDWLEAHDYGDLVRNAVVVLSMIRPRSKSSVDLDRLEHHFAGRCRSVIRIPYDAHLEEGAEVDLEQMSPTTFNAYLELAATVGDGFAWPRRAARQSALAANRQRWADRSMPARPGPDRSASARSAPARSAPARPGPDRRYGASAPGGPA